MQKRTQWIVIVLMLGMTTTYAYGQNDYRRNDRGPRIEFGKRAQTERLAAELYQKANSICWTMKDNYEQNRGFNKAYEKAYQILQNTKHIRELAKARRRWKNRAEDEIERDLASSDRLFHDLESDVANWRSNGRRTQRGGELRAEMNSFEYSLHDLMEDYGVKTKYDRRQERDRGHDHNH
jgi:hypothetical protein